MEVRPAWQGSLGEVTRRPIARCRFVKVTGQWQIYWMRSSGKWRSHEPLSEATELDAALMVIETDPYGCFFGESMAQPSPSIPAYESKTSSQLLDLYLLKATAHEDQGQ